VTLERVGYLTPPQKKPVALPLPKVEQRVHTSYQIDTKSNPYPNPNRNPNPTTKQHAIVSIRLNIVTMFYVSR